ncbi:MAG: shikimate kinase [Planctomycetota bacterium]
MGVVLVGYRACGKSHLARYLGQAWQLPHWDADAILEQETGKAIPSIFADDGEQAFRDLEADILRRLLARPGPFILATGGGVVEREANRRALMTCRHLVVYQQAPIALILERLERDAGDRPALSSAGLLTEVPTILARRDPWYRQVADLTLTADQTLERRALTISTALAKAEEAGV